MGVDAVKQSFWSHPLHRQTTLHQHIHVSQAERRVFGFRIFSLSKFFFSYIGGLFVVIDVVDIPGQTKVGDLHHIIFCDQHVPGCQVSVDTLQTTERAKVQLWMLF